MKESRTKRHWSLRQSRKDRIERDRTAPSRCLVKNEDERIKVETMKDERVEGEAVLMKAEG